MLDATVAVSVCLSHGSIIDAVITIVSILYRMFVVYCAINYNIIFLVLSLVVFNEFVVIYLGWASLPIN